MRSGGWWAAVVWGLLILALTLLPVEAVPGSGLLGRYHLDKVAHAFLFGVFLILLVRALRGAGRPNTMLVAVVVTVLYGALTEFLQEWMGAGRHGDPLDLLADIIGILLAAAWLRWEAVRSAQWRKRP